MENITNLQNKRLDELDRKMDFNICALKKVNQMLKQLKTNRPVEEVKFETFAGKPVKLVKSRQMR
jgi:phosphosulfolactate phosphohydrolase-like enzyme